VIVGTLTLLGIAAARQFGRKLGAMSYIAFILCRALVVGVVMGLSPLMLIALVFGAAIFVMYS
jgi:hypothetical protein